MGPERIVHVSVCPCKWLHSSAFRSCWVETSVFSYSAKVPSVTLFPVEAEEGWCHPLPESTTRQTPSPLPPPILNACSSSSLLSPLEFLFSPNQLFNKCKMVSPVLSHKNSHSFGFLVSLLFPFPSPCFSPYCLLYPIIKASCAKNSWSERPAVPFFTYGTENQTWLLGWEDSYCGKWTETLFLQHSYGNAAGIAFLCFQVGWDAA